jgi:hypothetical protein
MAEHELINPEEAYNKLKTGADLLVCEYDCEQKFKKMPLEGAISLDEFKSKFPSLSKDQEVIFYCG